MAPNNQNQIQGNLCSIFHARFKQLRQIIPNAKQAQLMDYILLGWQTSTYKLRNSDQKWFMKEYLKISEETGIPLSSIKRYLKEFEDEGLIERRQALYSRSNESGFEVKKGCYISIKQRLIDFLNPVHNQKQTNEDQSSLFKVNEVHHSDCSNFEKNETSENLNLRRSNIRDLYSTSNTNNISQNFFVKNVDKKEEERIKTVLSSIEHTLFKDIQEEIPDEVKKLVFGTLTNLVIKHKIFLSSPRQLAAEYLFTLINGDFFMSNIDCIKHRNNILSKLLRENRWTTPKGFYKHFYLGSKYKDKNELREKFWIKTKENEINNPLKLNFLDEEIRDPQLFDVDNKILQIGHNIDALKESLYDIREPELIIETRNTIEKHLKELAELYEEQKSIENQIEQEKNKTKYLLSYDVA